MGLRMISGLNSPETGKVIENLDAVLGALRAGISKLDIADKVNLIVLSDHGMGPISPVTDMSISWILLKEEWTEEVIGGILFT